MKTILTLFLLSTAVITNTQGQSISPILPYYKLDSQAKRALVDHAKTIKAGDSYQSVTNKLGVPTFDQIVVRKESGRIIGRTLSYYALIWESGLVNELLDELVSINLDEHDKVESINIRIKLDQLTNAEHEPPEGRGAAPRP